MGDLGSAKTLGGIGAILMLLGVFVPFLWLVGVILVYLGFKNISEHVNFPKIKSDFIIFVVFFIISNAMIFILPMLVFGGFSLGITSFATTSNPMDLGGTYGSIIAVCLIIWILIVIFNILSAIYFKKSCDSTTQATRVDMFKTAGIVYLIGAILLIIFIGIFIMLIAYILLAVAFFALPDQLQPAPQQGYGYQQPPGYGYNNQPPPQYYAPPQQQYQPPPQQQAPPPQQTGRFCSNCGKPIPTDAQVCPYCGKDYRQG